MATRITPIPLRALKGLAVLQTAEDTLLRNPSSQHAAQGHRRARHGAVALFLILLLVTVVPTLLRIDSTSGLPTGNGDAVRQLLYFVLFGYVVLSQRVVFDPGKLRVLPLGFVLLLAWCLVSVAWSIEPEIAARRFVLLLIVVLSIFLSIEATGTQRTLSVLRNTCALLLIVNYAAVFLSPLGVHTTAELDPLLAGDWRGLMPHKNTAGAICAFTLLLWLFTARRSAVRWVVVLATGVFLFQTQSKTSMGALGVALAFAAIFEGLKARGRLIAALAGVGLLGLAIVLGQQYVEDLGRYLSQPDSLTGRTQIWKMMWSYAESHALLGSGYGSFWDIGPDSPVYSGGHSWVAFMTVGHSGYLDVLVQLGLPGLLLAVPVLLLIPFWRLLTNDGLPRGTAAFLAGGMAFCVVHNVTETSLLERDHHVWILLLILLAIIGYEHRGWVDRRSVHPNVEESPGQRTVIAPSAAR
jgi:O-antigen ligase